MKSLLATALSVAFVMPVYALENPWDRPTPPLAQPKEMTVYRSPTCGCCGKWIAHMQKHGFVIKDVKRDEMDAIKRELGVPEELQSCHTAQIGNYVVEGHVPAGDVKRMLMENPSVTGLTVPGMVTGSPGMEMGTRKDPFKVFAFGRDGKTDPFSVYDAY